MLRAAVDVDPSEARIRYLLGSALLASGSTMEAIVEFERTLELDPNHAHARAARDAARQKPDE